MPTLVEDFFANPTGQLGTLKCWPWNVGGKALLLGDSAHAVVPFYGQGMNCAFEDAHALADLMLTHTDPGAAFQALRQPNAEAIADMAIENYIEMRDLVADREFLSLKALERAFAMRYPDRFVPRYSLVSFTTTPYAQARARGAKQLELLKRCRNLGVSAETSNWTEVDQIVASTDLSA